VAAGRLDRDSSGLLLLTNDTRLAHQVTDPLVGLPRTYIVKATGPLSEAQLEDLRRGVALSDGPARALSVTRLREPGGKTVFSLTLDEGRNRQVRRMVAAVGGKVQRLVRVALGPLEIGDLPVGVVRRLIPAEIRALERATSVPRRKPQVRRDRRR
jgi:pseudouridine synthase